MYCNIILQYSGEANNMGIVLQYTRVYCKGRKLEKCIAIGGLKEELYCKTKKGAAGSRLQYNFCIVTNSSIWVNCEQ